MSTTPILGGSPARHENDAAWALALQRVLAEPQRIRVHYQPIVDIQRGEVRGYEALARFPEAPNVAPVAWFDAAARLGYAGALEAQLVQAALVARPLLVRDRFIAVNVSPAALLSAEVQTALGAERRLDHIVIELTDRPDKADPVRLKVALDALRSAGTAIAVDETGVGTNSLERVISVRPQYIKVSGNVIAGVESDPKRVAMIETLSELATRLDSWVIAKGIETDGQLDALVRMGIPYGQGFTLGRPAPAMAELTPKVRARIRQRSVSSASASALGALMERVPAVEPSPQAVAGCFVSDPSLEHVVCVSADRRPLGILDRTSHERSSAPRPPMCLSSTMPVHEGARRAMARGLATRFDPIVCVDDDGAYTGIVAIDKIVVTLAR